MRIAIVNRHRDDRLGGSEIQCDFIAAGLQKRGHDVVYIASGGVDRQYNRSYPVVSAGESGGDIADHVLKAGPDVVYWRFNKHGFRQAVTKIRGNGIPFIFAASHIDDVSKWVVRPHLNVRKRVKQFIRNRWQHSGFQYVDALTVNNRDFLGRVDVPDQTFIPNGMNESKTLFEWPRPFIAWISNIKRVKRPELFVDLARRFESSGTDFLMSGHIQEPGYDWLQHRDTLPDNFHFVGPTSFEESSGMLAASEFVVHTCRPEGFPNVFIQAWVQGKPTISFGYDPGGCILTEELGFVADENRDLLVEQVQYLLDHPQRCKQIGTDARKFAKKAFSVDTCVESVEDLMKHVIAGKRA